MKIIIKKAYYQIFRKLGSDLLCYYPYLEIKYKILIYNFISFYRNALSFRAIKLYTEKERRCAICVQEVQHNGSDICGGT